MINQVDDIVFQFVVISDNQTITTYIVYGSLKEHLMLPVNTTRAESQTANNQ